MDESDLRPYQRAAVHAIRERYLAGDRATLLVLPTGTGKTVVFADIAHRVVERGGRVLVLAHGDELLAQAADKLRAVGIDPGLEKAAQRAGDALVVVASVQTLRGRRLASWPADAFRLLVIDEAHHATALTYRAILDHFTSARVLGVTATPDRLDGTPLGQVFDSVALQYELRDAIRDGWLARIEARRVRLAVDLDHVRTRAGDLDQAQLGDVYGTADAVREVVEPFLELAAERRSILFAVSVAHAERLAAAINDRAPDTARAVSGDAPIAVRRAAVEAFRRGDVRVLVNCQLFTEGFDVPEVECIAIARPTKSRALYAQMVGRGTRLAPGKESVLVLDFVGNTRRHRLVTPAAVLAGTDALPDEVVAAGEIEGDVLAALDRAHADRIEFARRSPEHLRFWAEMVDLFDVLEPAIDGPPATDRQREALVRAGMEPPPHLSRLAASALLARISSRRERGLATFKQMRLLARHGVDARSMTFEHAVARIDRLACGWRNRRAG